VPDPQPEPTPFEKFAALAKAVTSVPREEVQRREEEWKKARKEKKADQRPKP
jgi:hypothetical protein